MKTNRRNFFGKLATGLVALVVAPQLLKADPAKGFKNEQSKLTWPMKISDPIEYHMTRDYAPNVWVHVGEENAASKAGFLVNERKWRLERTAPGWYCTGNHGAKAYECPRIPLPRPNDLDSRWNSWVIFIPENNNIVSADWEVSPTKLI